MEESSINETSVLVVGGGNAAQTIAALASLRGISVAMFSPVPGEAKKLSTWRKRGSLDVAMDGQIFKAAAPKVITDDPKIAVQDISHVILAVPSFAQESCLRSLAAHLSPSVVIGALPGGACFDILARAALADSPAKACVLFATRTLAWSCRVTQTGESLEVLGGKKEDEFACSAAEPKEVRRIGQLLRRLTDDFTEYKQVASFLHFCFTLPWHPVFMFGAFGSWDGVSPFDKEPLFYEAISQDTAALLVQLSDEVLAIRDAIADRNVDTLDGVVSVEEWVDRSYGGSPGSPKKSLQEAIKTNPAYAGLKCPMKPHPTKDGWLPDFSTRYMTEDVPDVLVVHKGLAELCDVPTPSLDRLLRWAQQVMGKEYLVLAGEGEWKLRGKDLKDTRAPQRFGFTDLSDFLHDKIRIIG